MCKIPNKFERMVRLGYVVEDILSSEQFANIEGGNEIGRFYPFFKDLFSEFGEAYTVGDYAGSLELEKLYVTEYFWGSSELSWHVLYLYEFNGEPLTAELIYVDNRSGRNEVTFLEVEGYGDNLLSLDRKREIVDYVKSFHY